MQTQPRHIFLTILVACLTMAIGIGLALLAVQLEQQHQSSFLTTLIGLIGVSMMMIKIVLFFFLSPREKYRAWKSPLISYSSFLFAKKLKKILAIIVIVSGLLYGGILAFHEKYDLFSAHWELILVGFFSVCLALGLYGCGVTNFFIQKSQIGRGGGYLIGTPAMVDAVMLQLIGAGCVGIFLFLGQLFSQHPI